MDETLFQLVDIDWQTGTDEMGIWQLLIISLFYLCLSYRIQLPAIQILRIIDDVKPIFDKSSIKFIKSNLFIFHFFV